MAELNIFQQGDKVKFIITSLNPLLDMEVCDFRVELIYGMPISKNQPHTSVRSSVKLSPRRKRTATKSLTR